MSKEQAALVYKSEGKRRMLIRKAKRKEAFIKKKTTLRSCGNPWKDDNSPTGWSQVCDYQHLGSFGESVCQYPCNGDC